MWVILFLWLFLIVNLPHSSLATELTGAGATFPQIVYQAWAYEYYKQTGVKVNYQGIGSEGGIKQAKSKTVDFGATDVPLDSSELRKYNLAQFPTVIGAVVVVYNIPEIGDLPINLDGKAICNIYLGKIKKWNDPYLQKLNPALKLPARPIKVVRRAEASGTSWLFTTYLSKVCREWKEKVGAGKLVNWPVGIGAKGNPGVANYVRQNPGAIGYVEYSYAIQNELPVAKLLNGEKTSYVAPTIETIKSAAKYAKWSLEKDFKLDLILQPGKKSYPIVATTYILLIKDNPKVKEVTKFFKWAFEKGDYIAKRTYYIPLPKNVKNLIYKYWKIHGVNP